MILSIKPEIFSYRCALTQYTMTESELSKDYWQTSQVITGFAAIQAIAFFYAATSDKAPQLLKQTDGRASFLILAIAGYCLYGFGAWWSGREAIHMAELAATKAGTAFPPELRGSMRYANRARVVCIAFFLVAGSFAILYV